MNPEPILNKYKPKTEFIKNSSPIINGKQKIIIKSLKELKTNRHYIKKDS